MLVFLLDLSITLDISYKIPESTGVVEQNNKKHILGCVGGPSPKEESDFKVRCRLQG